MQQDSKKTYRLNRWQPQLFQKFIVFFRIGFYPFIY
jgi:hypothetical protein